MVTPTRRMIILLALLLIFQLSGSTVNSEYISYPRNISCHICHPNIRPNFGCDREIIYNGYNDFRENRCHQCGVWEEWRISRETKSWEKVMKARICIVNGINTGCTYHYPAGSKGVVHEICRCKANLCNDNQHMTSPVIGGIGDPVRFPPPKRQTIKLAVLSSASQITPKLTLNYVIAVPQFIYLLQYHN